MRAGSVGGGILLVVIGAILAFALNLNTPGVDLHMIGIILIIAGVVLGVIGLVFAGASEKRQSDSVRGPRQPR